MIRRAAPSDAPAIDALVQGAYGHYPDRLGLRPAPMDADYLHEIATKEVWVTPAEGHVQGVIVLRCEDDHMVVDNVAVHPYAQGLGLGRALLEYAERRAADHGVAEVRLLTHELMTENRALYAHLGYSPLPRPPDERLPRVRLGKRLRCK